MDEVCQPCANPIVKCGTHRGYRNGCRCLGCRFAMREHNKRYRDANRESVRQSQRRRELKADYGITLEQLHEMKRAQGWRCAICRKNFPPAGDDSKRVHIDHCHKTKRIRGILCASCNAGLGRFGDSVEGLRRALAYLEEFEKNL